MLTRKSLESRRMQAIELLKSGWSQADIARKFDVSEGAVSNWKKKWKEEGKRSLRAQPHSGRPSKLSVDQRSELIELLTQGAKECGFETNDWTCPRVKQLIQDRFEVTFHVDHLCRLLRQLGFSPQRPKRRSKKHSAEAIATWRRKDWKRIKKGV